MERRNHRARSPPKRRRSSSRRPTASPSASEGERLFAAIARGSASSGRRVKSPRRPGADAPRRTAGRSGCREDDRHPSIFFRRSDPTCAGRLRGQAPTRFMSTLVSGGRVASAMISQLSKPTSETASGTPSPISRNASATPRAIWSLPQKIASGRWRRDLNSCGHRLASPAFRPNARQIIAIRFGQSRFGKRSSIPVPPQAHRLETLRAGHMGDPLAPEPDKVTRRQRRAAFVVGNQATGFGVLDLRKDVDHRDVGGTRSASRVCRRGGR